MKGAGWIVFFLVSSLLSGVLWLTESRKRKPMHFVSSTCARGSKVMLEDAGGMGPPMLWCEAVEMGGRTIHVSRRFPEGSRPMSLSFGDNFTGRMRIVVEEAEEGEE